MSEVLSRGGDKDEHKGYDEDTPSEPAACSSFLVVRGHGMDDGRGREGRGRGAGLNNKSLF